MNDDLDVKLEKIKHTILQQIILRLNSSARLRFKNSFINTKFQLSVIAHRIPLRGKEVKFLRKAIGLSLEKFTNKLGLTSGSIFHWEKAEDQRLSPVNEAIKGRVSPSNRRSGKAWPVTFRLPSAFTHNPNLNFCLA